MTVFIIATKVKQFNYYLHFPHAHNGSYRYYTFQGLKDNATHFIDQTTACSIAAKLFTDREYFIDTLKIEKEKIYDHS